MNPRTREQKENRLFNKISGIVTRSSLLLIKNLQGVSVPRARIQWIEYLAGILHSEFYINIFYARSSQIKFLYRADQLHE